MSAATDVPTLKFADKHVDRILGDKKTATIRLDLETEAFQIGRRFQLVDETSERFASAIVDDRGYTTVEMAARMDIDGHQSYRDTEDLLKTLRGYYPDREIDANTRVELVYWDWDELWE